jgi:glycerol uptake facilitator-like aquaporin
VQVALSKRLVAEALGTALLVAAVVGSGIMGVRLAGGNVAIALLANSLATGGALVALIVTFGPISGAHFNPIVSLAMVFHAKMTTRDALAYAVAQIAGGIAGAILANVMFDLAPIAWSTTARHGMPLLISEVVAAFGLVAVVLGVSRRGDGATTAPFAVAGYIVAAYWFTASTSFANPAVTIARAFSDTFAGIQLADVGGFIGAQIVGGVAAALLFRVLR